MNKKEAIDALYKIKDLMKEQHRLYFVELLWNVISYIYIEKEGGDK